MIQCVPGQDSSMLPRAGSAGRKWLGTSCDPSSAALRVKCFVLYPRLAWLYQGWSGICLSSGLCFCGGVSVAQPRAGRIETQPISSLTGPSPTGPYRSSTPYAPWRSPGPERGRIKGQTISSLAGPWPREGAYQKPKHLLRDGALAPRGAYQRSSHMLLDGALAPRGAYHRSNHILLDGALAPRGGVSKVKPCTP